MVHVKKTDVKSRWIDSVVDVYCYYHYTFTTNLDILVVGVLHLFFIHVHCLISLFRTPPFSAEKDWFAESFRILKNVSTNHFRMKNAEKNAFSADYVVRTKNELKLIMLQLKCRSEFPNAEYKI